MRSNCHPGTYCIWHVYVIIIVTVYLQSQAASTPIYCATSAELNGLSDAYYKDCRRCEESDLAQDLHLSFRIYDLTKELLHDRVAARDDVIRVEAPDAYPDQTKHSIDEATLVANYSG